MLHKHVLSHSQLITCLFYCVRPVTKALYDMEIKNRVKRLIFEKNMVSHMNNTRWSELLPLLKGMAKKIDVKWVLSEDTNGWAEKYQLPTDGYFEPLPLGPISFREIEWLLIDPIEFSEAKETLSKLKVPITIEGSWLRVWGYTHGARSFV